MKFSIITVVKNDLSKIRLTFQSLKNQIFKDYEHIILDSNSTDGTSEFLKKNLNEKILYFRENDKGIYDALNKSFKKASGQYYLILHAGDFFIQKTLCLYCQNLLIRIKILIFITQIFYFIIKKIIK